MTMVHEVNVLNFLIATLGHDRLYKSLEPSKLHLKIGLVELNLLKPHEDVMASVIRVVEHDINSCDCIRFPIVVDIRTLAILDGHHRVYVLKELGVRYVPAFLVDYAEDSITVSPIRREIPVDKVIVLKKILIEKNIFPPKTTRHSYHGYTIPSLHIGLEELSNIDKNRRFTINSSSI